MVGAPLPLGGGPFIGPGACAPWYAEVTRECGGQRSGGLWRADMSVWSDAVLSPGMSRRRAVYRRRPFWGSCRGGGGLASRRGRGDGCGYCCCEGTQHVPAGEIARHALPGQGAREQSAGVTLAGRVPTTTEGGGGGGGAPWSGGGRGAWRRAGPPVEVTLEPSSVLRGESYSSCAKRLWWGWRAGR